MCCVSTSCLCANFTLSASKRKREGFFLIGFGLVGADASHDSITFILPTVCSCSSKSVTLPDLELLLEYYSKRTKPLNERPLQTMSRLNSLCMS